VTTRLWTYHLVHSNLIMLFLLVALWRQAVARPRPVAIIAFAAVALTLWLPAKASDLRPVVLVQYAVWIGGLVILLRSEAEDPRRVGVGRDGGIEDRTESQACWSA
jgi:hypothetical protein